MRTTGLLLFACALASCGSDLRWQKAGADEGMLAGDLSACRKQVQATYGGAAAMATSSPLDPRFGPTGPSAADQMMQQSQAVGTCMRGKGYILVPAGK